MKKENKIKCLSCDKKINENNLKNHSETKSHLKNVDKKVNAMKQNIIINPLYDINIKLKVIELEEKFGNLAIDVVNEVINAIKHEDNKMYYEIKFWNEVKNILETK